MFPAPHPRTGESFPHPERSYRTGEQAINLPDKQN
jgi:hypothetical protein